ncbi:hypothetical protein llg_34240 [Luteolibacter sp. LG18]|nr:hypothetical protein llg_34240 [Luteolibacter sp. LG18]
MDSGTPTPRGFDNAVATFLRTVQNHHVALSQMADQKANVLIGASFVVLSILFHEVSQHGLTPTLGMLSGTCFTACFFAALAIFPRAKKEKDRTPNPLFFGSFAQHPREDFHRELDAILSSDSSITHAMAEDIYQLGCVLHRYKYRYLRYAYRTFLVGLTLTAATALLWRQW